MHRYFLEIAYDGTQFHGWQIQLNAHSVQAALQQALALYYRHSIETTGCGRTDTGVHSTSYFLHFDLPKEIEDINKDIYKLNGLLPSDIGVLSLREVQPNAHARFDAQIRKYQYHIHSHKDPFLENRSMQSHYALDIAKMNEACNLLLKTEDFASFCKSGSDAKTTICHLQEARWEQNGHQLIFHIAADRFLRNMVRAVVGTLVDVGRDKISITEFQNAVAAKKRSAAGKSVDACGLYLTEVAYDWPSISK
jgi:tRNA pseudouridine38-40 synthase